MAVGTKEWYMSIEVPGGDFAVQATSLNNAWKAIQEEVVKTFTVDGKGTLGREVLVRKAPPILQRWLSAEKGVWDLWLSDGEINTYRTITTGGWLYRHVWPHDDYYIEQVVVVPVPNSIGLAILPEAK